MSKEQKEQKDTYDDDKVPPVRPRLSEKTSRRMSFQDTIRNVAIPQEQFTSTDLHTTGGQSIRINKQIEQKYLLEIEKMDNASSDKLFNLGDILDSFQTGMNIVVSDDFSLCFKRPERRPWNFTAILFVMWLIGVLFRYLILFPLRLLVMILSIATTLLSFWIFKKVFKNDPVKCEQWELWSLQLCVQAIIASWGGVIEYKGVIAKKKDNQIYVSNHTTMLDWLLLAQMKPFCVVGQLQSSRPLVKWFQTELLKSLNCIWFNRSEQKDRSLAMKRIKEHISDSSKPRLLIFPEGTCVNNEYCIQFKKGAFSLGCEICPIAIRYNRSFIDAYWISRERPFHLHLMDFMTSWALVAEVYYLEPQTIMENETAIEFSARIKKMVADAAGLKNVSWNGYLKHYKPSERVINAQKKITANALERLFENNKLNKIHEEHDVENDGVFVNNQNKQKNETRKR